MGNQHTIICLPKFVFFPYQPTFRVRALVDAFRQRQRDIIIPNFAASLSKKFSLLFDGGYRR